MHNFVAFFHDIYMESLQAHDLHDYHQNVTDHSIICDVDTGYHAETHMYERDYEPDKSKQATHGIHTC